MLRIVDSPSPHLRGLNVLGTHDGTRNTPMYREPGTVTVPEAVPTSFLSKVEEEYPGQEFGRNGYRDRYEYGRDAISHSNEHRTIACFLFFVKTS